MLCSPNFQLVLREVLDCTFRVCAKAMVEVSFPEYRHALRMCDETAPTPAGVSHSTFTASGDAGTLDNPRKLLPKVIPKMSGVARHVLRYPQRADGGCDPSQPWLVGAFCGLRLSVRGHTNQWPVVMTAATRCAKVVQRPTSMLPQPWPALDCSSSAMPCSTDPAYSLSNAEAVAAAASPCNLPR